MWRKHLIDHAFSHYFSLVINPQHFLFPSGKLFPTCISIPKKFKNKFWKKETQLFGNGKVTSSLKNHYCQDILSCILLYIFLNPDCFYARDILENSSWKKRYWSSQSQQNEWVRIDPFAKPFKKPEKGFGFTELRLLFYTRLVSHVHPHTRVCTHIHTHTHAKCIMYTSLLQVLQRISCWEKDAL